MTPTKLSDSDKHEILRLYRQSDENTITLAKRYGVSSSTVRRILQNGLSEEEYETLVQQKQKRSPHSSGSIAESPEPTDEETAINTSEPVPTYPAVPQATPNSKLIRKRSAVASEPSPSILGGETRQPGSGALEAEGVDLLEDDYEGRTGNLEEILGEDLLDREEDFSDFDDDEEDDEDLDDFDGEDLEDDDLLFQDSRPIRPGLSLQLRPKTIVQVLPLSEASLPRICYLVVDRAAELITRPLKAFGELGQIPAEEIGEKTLPVFDNHRVARRFSTRNQRVCKVPDGRLLQKTAPYLQAKGITRLLIDGQVYSL